MSDGGLDPRLVEWVGSATGGTVTRLERALARREAWIVDVAKADGSSLELFLRVAHEGDPANSAAALDKEASIVRALASTDVPVPGVLASDAKSHAVLFERVGGRTDLHHTASSEQDVVYRHYLEVLASLHRLDPAHLDIGDLHWPVDARDCALAEVDMLAGGIKGFGPQPLARFGMSWLARHAPPVVDRIALVHGDAGIANFLFAESRVTAAIDWEWSHLGDPIEDLGGLCIHASFSPSGDWPALLRHYGDVSGTPVDLDKVFYYRVNNMARSVLALVPIRQRVNARDPVALNLCFAVICDRMLCEAIADAMKIQLERPALPDLSDVTTLYDVVVENLGSDVAPHVDGEFPRDRLTTSILLVQTLAREHELRSWREATELDELQQLLGERPADLTSGYAALEEVIEHDDGARDEEILRALGRIAFRSEAVAAPVVSLFPDARLRPIV
jgi:aminoglycoside phosphotransferase (APT) family kinase protein